MKPSSCQEGTSQPVSMVSSMAAGTPTPPRVCGNRRLCEPFAGLHCVPQVLQAPFTHHQQRICGLRVLFNQLGCRIPACAIQCHLGRAWPGVQSSWSVCPERHQLCQPVEAGVGLRSQQGPALAITLRVSCHYALALAKIRWSSAQGVPGGPEGSRHLG